ncbi:RNA-directed DNA polymerase from mobile element jockey [Paramuricea clavata]|uniref:RNA-directed DNA polymerase from mobile element jockey n=1 Tax=Paramuricea clavata TaxID=317549 RepID=A0A6S7HUT1_PARCT|nr:RNA-directed DNA polymerase from mobile element jockey [Paramuricea clavata]
MINDLELASSSTDHWKYVDDVTISESLKKNEVSVLQSDLNTIERWTVNNNMKLNGKKCKEMIVSFVRSENDIPRLLIDGLPLDLVPSFKLLGLTMNNKLKWQDNTEALVKKASKRLYIIRVLQRCGYACPVWHTMLPKCLGDKIGKVQKRAFRIIYPTTDYEDALNITQCKRLDDKSYVLKLCAKTCKKILKPDAHLNHLLPPLREESHELDLRNNSNFTLTKCRTERFKTSFIPAMTANFNNESCDPWKFYCPVGICIPWNSTCNGISDCPSGADEPSICGNTSRANESCSLNDLGCLVNLINETFCEDSTDGSCDFEQDGFCKWQQVHDGHDDFDWSINNGETSSKQTGPRVDHTSESELGSYIYIEASSPRVKGDKAIIQAGPFKADQNFCFTFYYHMFGVHIGRLSVYQAWSNMTNLELLWTRNTSGDDSWKTSSLDVRSRNNFYLMIEAVCGEGAKGDIAVDDFSMIDKKCSEIQNDNLPFCSFESLCAWKMTPGVWVRMPVNNKKQFMLHGKL